MSLMCICISCAGPGVVFDLFLWKKYTKSLTSTQFFAIYQELTKRQPPKEVRIVKAREVVKKLKADGWYVLKRKATSHVQLKHPVKPGKVTVSDHKGKEIPSETLDSIEKQSGVSMR